MKKIVFICPYFGKLPKEQMAIWLKTCEKNPKVNWIVITDDKTSFNYPQNVKVIYTTFESMKKDFQKKFDFDISMNSPYKLCDFKPTYGYVFQDLIKDYDYWGHCDLSDSIFGNIEKTLNKIVEQDYDKIGFLGHLTLYKNKKEVNERFFMKSKSNKSLNEILGVSDNMAFDETNNYSINFVYLDNGFEIKRIDELYYDISTRSSSFRTPYWSDKLKWEYLLEDRCIFEWDNGNLYKIYLKNEEIKKEEILYVHYQKRKMTYEINIEKSNHFLIVPNKFIECDKVDIKTIKKYTRNSIINKTLLNIRINKIKNKLKGK